MGVLFLLVQSTGVLQLVHSLKTTWSPRTIAKWCSGDGREKWKVLWDWSHYSLLPFHSIHPPQLLYPRLPHSSHRSLSTPSTSKNLMSDTYQSSPKPELIYMCTHTRTHSLLYKISRVAESLNPFLYGLFGVYQPHIEKPYPRFLFQVINPLNHLR